MGTHRAIEETQRAMMNALAATIDEFLNGKDPAKPRKIGFVLLTAPFGEPEGGRVNYMSNGDRQDMVVMMKELLARFEGRHPEETQAGGTETRQ